MPNPAKYNIIKEFGLPDDQDELSLSVYWVVAVIRLGAPISFSRKKMASASTDITAGAMLRNEAPLIITDDCLSVSIQNSKNSHTKSASFSLKPSDIQYANEILPGDWCFAWIVRDEEKYESLKARISKGEQSNFWDDGLKFLGRINGVRTSVQVEHNSGMKVSSVTVNATGFQELDTMLFYDHTLASQDIRNQDLGLWLARLGLKTTDLFQQSVDRGISPNNVNDIIPTLFDLIVGKGPKTVNRSDANIPLVDVTGHNQSATPTFDNEAPFSYLVPLMAGQLLGVKQRDASKPSKIISYADILEFYQGVQSYSEKQGTFEIFVPDQIDSTSTARRHRSPKDMLGTFLPQMPEFTNQPLWHVFQQYLNPTINEIYTGLKVNQVGEIMPSFVMRQIPFTTQAFVADSDIHTTNSRGGSLPVTRFLEMPRWVIPDVMISSYDVGRSDATHFNFFHIYGQSSHLTSNVPVQLQLLQNPPVRDDIDIMRSGLRPYMATVECWFDDQLGSTPRAWIDLVADFLAGGQFTYNGTLQCFGIQSPICEGDNLEFDGVVYHIESLVHNAQIDAGGNKSWMTTVSLSNGLRADVPDDAGDLVIYPGIAANDNTRLLPGYSNDQVPSTGGTTDLSVKQPASNDPSRLAAATDGSNNAVRVTPGKDK